MKPVLWVVVFVALCGITGCGPGGVEVDGKVVNGNAPYTLADGEAINISLGNEKVSASATVQKDGTFVAKTSDGKPIPPGQYKVSLVHYPPVAEGAKSKGPPMSQIKTAGETWDISSSNKSFTLDISKYKVKQ